MLQRAVFIALIKSPEGGTPVSYYGNLCNAAVAPPLSLFCRVSMKRPVYCTHSEAHICAPFYVWLISRWYYSSTPLLRRPSLCSGYTARGGAYVRLISCGSKCTCFLQIPGLRCVCAALVPTGLVWCNEHGLRGQAMCEWWNVQCVSGLLWTLLYLGAEHVDYHLLCETV